MILGALLILAGVGACLLQHVISIIDTGSVGVLIARGDFDVETLHTFRFTPWREPTAEIQPFPSRRESLEKGRIIRYRQGTRMDHPLFRQTYYEAEYLMPDGKMIIGPALGPVAFTSPNYAVSIPVILGGAIMLVLAMRLSHKKSEQAAIQEFRHE